MINLNKFAIGDMVMIQYKYLSDIGQNPQEHIYKAIGYISEKKEDQITLSSHEEGDSIRKIDEYHRPLHLRYITNSVSSENPALAARINLEDIIEIFKLMPVNDIALKKYPPIEYT